MNAARSPRRELILDAHLDLALNAIEWNRDLTRPLGEIRSAEAHLRDKPGRGRGTVCLPELRRGRIGIVVTTQLARIEHDAYSPVFGWKSQTQAWAMTQGQLAWYEAMTDAGEMTPIRTRAEFERCLGAWESADDDRAAELPIGYVLSLEGADSLAEPGVLERAFASGVRAIGPAHYGPGVYAMGTDAEGRFPPRGRELLAEIARLGMILDVTHLSDASLDEVLDTFDGPLWASHHNCRALVPGQRQLSDDQISRLAERDAVIGTAFDAWMLSPNWARGKTQPQERNLRIADAVDHIDRICQLTGNARHVGIGSDLDGAFGTEQTPLDLDSIADLAGLPALLAGRGFSSDDIRCCCRENFARVLRRGLPGE